jgi:putative transposase
VTRSGFYASQHRPESRHAQRDRQWRTLIRAAHAESGHRYGSPRIYEDLVEQGEAVRRKRVVRLMQADGCVAGYASGSSDRDERARSADRRQCP